MLTLRKLLYVSTEKRVIVYEKGAMVARKDPLFYGLDSAAMSRAIVALVEYMLEGRSGRPSCEEMNELVSRSPEVAKVTKKPCWSGGLDETPPVREEMIRYVLARIFRVGVPRFSEEELIGKRLKTHESAYLLLRLMTQVSTEPLLDRSIPKEFLHSYDGDETLILNALKPYGFDELKEVPRKVEPDLEWKEGVGSWRFGRIHPECGIDQSRIDKLIELAKADCSVRNGHHVVLGGFESGKLIVWTSFGNEFGICKPHITEEARNGQ